MLGHVHALGDIVGLEVGAAPEGAAGEQGLDLHRARQGAGDLAGVELVHGGDLGAEGELMLAAADLGHAVHRLHGGVGEIREVVGDLHRRAGHGRGCVAGGLEGLPLGLAVRNLLARGDGVVAGQDRIAAAPLGLAVVPVDLERVAALARGPGGARDHGDAGRDLEHVHDARHSLGGLGVEALHLAAEARRVGHHGGEHVGQVDVLGEPGRTVRLGPRVLAPHPVGAHQGERLGILQRRVFRRLDLGRVGHQLAERRRLARGVANDTVLHRHLPGRHGPARGRRLDEHGPRAGAGAAQLHPGIGDGRRPAGSLNSHAEVAIDLGVGRRLLDLQRVPVGVQFLGRDGGQAGVVALAEFDVLGDHRHRAVGGYLDEGAKGAEVVLGADGQQRRGRAADQQGAAGGGRGHHQYFAAGGGATERRRQEGFHGSIHRIRCP